MSSVTGKANKGSSSQLFTIKILQFGWGRESLKPKTQHVVCLSVNCSGATGFA